MNHLPREENPLPILAYIVFSTAIIFYIDIITPLGFIMGILYFIPLFLTVYLSWRHAPFLSTGVFILLIFAGFLFSPRDISGISMLFAFLNRVFLSLLLLVSAFFIRGYTRNLEELRVSEERYRFLTEYSPDAVIVYNRGRILYTNPAGIRLFGADTKEELMGKDIVERIDPGDRETFAERIGQAALGANMFLDRVRMIRFNGDPVQVQAALGRVVWDGQPAIQVILRDITYR
ncbi:MAG: PAS domain S-box protein [Methanomicrobiales archaeon]|jgi:PAS domain S-box-containing protein